MLSDTMMLGGGRKAAFSIENSLLFRGGQYLSRTPAAAGNRKVWTWSGWLRPITGGPYSIFSAGNAQMGGTFTGAVLEASGELFIYWNNSSTGASSVARLRDCGGYYHLVLKATGTELIAYVNNQEMVRKAYSGDGEINNTTPMRMGGYLAGGAMAGQMQGYLSEPLFIDGQALDPAAFGEFDPATGSWRPKKLVGIDFGPNGFRLGKPWDRANKGADASGRGNDWTAHGFADTDVMKDSPTNVYAVFNRLLPNDSFGQPGAAVLSNGNLRLTSNDAAYNSWAVGTLPVASGKYYFEWFTDNANSDWHRVGLVDAGKGVGPINEPYADQRYFFGLDGKKYRSVNEVWVGSSYGAVWSGPGTSIYDNHVIGCAVDMDVGCVWWSIDGVWQASGNPATGANPAFSDLAGKAWLPCAAIGSLPGTAGSMNFGQRPFVHSPPTGFKALCSANLPAPISPAAKRPWKYYACKTFTTTGGMGSFSVGWNPNPANGGSHTLFRIKRVDDVSNWWWIDTVRGLDKVLSSDSTAAENTLTVISSVSSNGTVTVSLASGYTYVVEAWRMAPEAGFDIVTWTGDGTSNRQIGHGLASVPAFGTVKCRDTNSVNNTWLTQHTAMAADHYLMLNDASGQTPISTTLHGALGTFTNAATISLAAGTVDSRNVNEDGKRYVAYVWSQVPGFSAFGSYQGNAATDGPFVGLGFAPAEVTGKRVDGSSVWGVQCLALDDINPVQAQLYLNQSNASDTGNDVDFLSNGVKLRNSTSWNNASGGKYLTAAWAAHPLGAKRVTPATAR